MQKNMGTPFGWIGGKSQLTDDIMKKMPKHNLYVEVFGVLWLCFMLKKDNYHQTIVRW